MNSPVSNRYYSFAISLSLSHTHTFTHTHHPDHCCYVNEASSFTLWNLHLYSHQALLTCNSVQLESVRYHYAPNQRKDSYVGGGLFKILPFSYLKCVFQRKGRCGCPSWSPSGLKRRGRCKGPSFVRVHIEPRAWVYT